MTYFGDMPEPPVIAYLLGQNAVYLDLKTVYEETLFQKENSKIIPRPCVT